MAQSEVVRCPKCQGAVWNDVFSEVQPTGYRFTCRRCGFTVKISGCKACGHPMELAHGVDPKGPHRPFFRFRCAHCGREVSFQGDVYADSK